MSMGERRPERQPDLFVASGDLARSPGHPFYDRLNKLLIENEFDRFVEEIRVSPRKAPQPRVMRKDACRVTE